VESHRIDPARDAWRSILTAPLAPRPRQVTRSRVPAP
jgi:hypothetical protein